MRPRGEQRSVLATRGARLHDSSRGRPLRVVSRRRRLARAGVRPSRSSLPSQPPSGTLRWWALKGPPPSPPSGCLRNPPRLHQPGEQVLMRPRPGVQPSCALATTPRPPPRLPYPGRAEENAPESQAFPDAYCPVANRNCSGGCDRRVVAIAGTAGSATSPRGRRAGVPARDRLPSLPAPGRTAPRPGLFGLAQQRASRRAAAGAERGRKTKAQGGSLQLCLRRRGSFGERVRTSGLAGNQDPTGSFNKWRGAFTNLCTRAYTDAQANAINFADSDLQTQPRSFPLTHTWRSGMCVPTHALAHAHTKGPKELQFAPTLTRVYTSHALI